VKLVLQEENLEGVAGRIGLLCFATGDFAGVVFTTAEKN
jgi:hypothetical protein